MKAVVLTALLSACAWTPVMAQTLCFDRGKGVEALATRHQEKPVAVGIAANGAAVELLKAEDGKTWTLIVTYPSGMSCALASGTDWSELNPEYGVEG